MSGGAEEGFGITLFSFPSTPQERHEMVSFDLPHSVRILVAIISLAVTTNSSALGLKSDPNLNYIKDMIEKAMDSNAKKNENQGFHAPKPPIANAFQIVQFLNFKDHLVLIDGGSEDGIVEGAVFEAYRMAPSPTGEGPGIKVMTGILKSYYVYERFTLARVTAPGGPLADAFFPDFSGVMAHDWVVERHLEIAQNPILSPTKTILYNDLFVDPMADPTSFELTEEGRDLLREQAKVFQNYRLPVLFVEAYTDDKGPANANQLESYQRALTVRQFLINEMGFQPSRVVAIGQGELENVAPGYVDGYINSNRRVVLKVNVHAKRSH